MKNTNLTRGILFRAISLLVVTSTSFLITDARASGVSSNEPQPTLPKNIAVEGFELALAPVPAQDGSLSTDVELTLKNVTDQSLPIMMSNPYADYYFEVKDETGHIIAQTNFGIDAPSLGDFGNILMRVKPGFTPPIRLSLSRIRDLSKDGVFDVKAFRTVFHRTGEGTATLSSNTIRLDVVHKPLAGIVVKNQGQTEESKNQKALPSQSWQVGDTWKVAVEVFRFVKPVTAVDIIQLDGKLSDLPKKSVQIVDKYLMTIRVAKVEVIGDKKQAELDFTPGVGSPSYVSGESVKVIIDQNTNQLLEVKSTKLKGNSITEKFDNETVIVRPLNGYAVGFPLDIIPQTIVGDINKTSFKELFSPDKSMRLSISQIYNNDTQLLQEKLTVDNKDWFRITQIRPILSKFWSQYLKEDFDSQVGMRATVLGSSKIIWGTSVNNIQLGISSVDSLSQGGGPIRMRIGIRNNSDQDISLKSLFRQSPIKILLTDHQDHQAVQTAFGKLQLKKINSLIDVDNLPAYADLYLDVDIDRLFDMTVEDTYEASVTLQAPTKITPDLYSPIAPIKVMY